MKMHDILRWNFQYVSLIDIVTVTILFIAHGVQGSNGNSMKYACIFKLLRIEFTF